MKYKIGDKVICNDDTFRNEEMNIIELEPEDKDGLQYYCKSTNSLTGWFSESEMAPVIGPEPRKDFQLLCPNCCEWRYIKKDSTSHDYWNFWRCAFCNLLHIRKPK